MRNAGSNLICGKCSCFFRFVGADAHIGPKLIPPPHPRMTGSSFDEPFPRGEGAPEGRMRNAGGNPIRRTSPYLLRTPCLSLWECSRAQRGRRGCESPRTANTLSVTAYAVPALPEGEPRAPAALFHPPHPQSRRRGRLRHIGPFGPPRICRFGLVWASVFTKDM